ncbi:hypothetical protein [Burkholderia territorii]|uniref:hypothetical protein n=1 Tax=Burkholderia territorii TaxID=1503055 RepID=UPI00075CAD97|nr:hypothetical protein [Burkholderia territorii]KWE37420.1 hypothetical protein WT49_11335 [Burkholderia territorii]KWE38460.1 hypothetical protein WT50_20190 [Burkholderia territorii]KWE40339.1 hypothetical protein WT51_28085 [Burkholderia territorii]
MASAERIQLLVIQDEISKLPEDDRTKIDSIAAQFRAMLDAEPTHAMMALALVGAEAADKVSG